MLAISTSPAYDFIGKRRWADAVSVAVMLLGLTLDFVKGGLHYDIDFTGGTLVEVRLPQPLPLGEIPLAPDRGGTRESIIQIFDDPRDVLIRTQLSRANPTELEPRIVGRWIRAERARLRFAAWSSWDPRSETSCAGKRCTPSSPLWRDPSSTSGCAPSSEAES